MGSGGTVVIEALPTVGRADTVVVENCAQSKLVGRTTTAEPLSVPPFLEHSLPQVSEAHIVMVPVVVVVELVVVDLVVDPLVVIPLVS